jgi:L-cysteine:1D-myo-inositol 2-amino-2-deoxy-alpha-D-glucopyranoside ligase
VKLYNSLSGRKEKFLPLDDQVKMYVCGITPYDTTHLGHAFTYTFFDVLARYLRFKGWQVKYVQNITDVDDDILKKAKEVGMDWRKLGDKWIQRYFADMKAINNRSVDVWTRASAYMGPMLEIVKDLLAKGVAYEVGGNVYFSVRKYEALGKLSRLPADRMLAVANERGNHPDDPGKRDPLDFVLWQKSRPGEPAWKSPWGRGRPGWHLECSAMVVEELGETIDIHGGGRDLEFPHHEFEIAQSEAYTGRPFVRFWMHVAMLGYQGEKMSKSLGNLVMVEKLLRRYSANAIRILLLSHHYRTPWEYDEAAMIKAQRKADRLDRFWRQKGGDKKTIETDSLKKEFLAALDDDMDTPRALETLIRAAAAAVPRGSNHVETDVSFFREAHEILGLRVPFPAGGR